MFSKASSKTVATVLLAFAMTLLMEFVGIGLIVPAVFHDGDKFPEYLSDIQRFDVHKWSSPRMPENCKAAQKLDRAINREAPAIAHAILSAPEWQREWPLEAAEHLRRELKLQRARQTSTPSFTR